MKCPECGIEVEREDVERHYDTHKVKTIGEDPLVLLLDLPDGCAPGRLEAAEAFMGGV